MNEYKFPIKPEEIRTVDLQCSIAEMVNRAFQQGKTEAIDECIEKLYEVTPQTVDQKLDMVFVNALRELKEQNK